MAIPSTVVLSPHPYFCRKGVVWLMLAVFAEVPPVVCGLIISPHLSVQSVHPCSTIQVLIILNMGGNAFLSMMEEY